MSKYFNSGEKTLDIFEIYPNCFNYKSLHVRTYGNLHN